MKRLLILLVVLSGVVILLLGQPVFGQEKHAESLPLASHFSKTYKDDLSGLLKRKYIRVLTTFNKTNFFISEGRAFGYEYCLLKEYEKYLNKDIPNKALRVVIEFIPVPRDQLIPGLVEGYGDIAAAGLTITKRRSAKVDFTDPYLTGINEIVVTHRNGPEIQSPEDLSGKRVFVRKSASYYDSLMKVNKRLLFSLRPPVTIIRADENLETEDILEMVNAGAVGITVSDSHIADIWSRFLKNLRLHRDVKLRKGSRIAWAVRKNNPALKESLNNFLKSHRKGTLLGNIYFNRYYKDNRWMENPLGPRGIRKMHKYESLFRKYATRYGFDWKLVMATAYQESRLDHSERSAAGAVGIMQVLPSTARSRRVGIKNVHDLESNVHAGVKYLAFLRDHYFDDRDIRPRDRVRLTLAAYNAGPGNIAKSRRVAENMGLNPNRWFRNVEFGALKVIGQETVKYVSNINKYYLMYGLGERNMVIRKRMKREY